VTDRTPPEEQTPRTESLVKAALLGEASGEPVASGFPGLDGLLGGGFRRGDLVVLAGDTAVGKSSLALAIALRVTAAGRSAAYLTGEMTAARLLERALAMEGRVRVDDFRRGALDDVAHAAVATAALALRERAPLCEDLRDAGVPGVSDFLAQHLGLELTIIDSVQALALGRMALDEELADAARRLKELALRRGTIILAVSGLADSPAGRANPRPLLRDIGGLGVVSQHADVVLGLYREELYDPSRHVEGAAELAVLKNRNGPTGFVDLFFYKQWLRFEDMLEPDR
jgi:replicative DNA helicase